MKEKEHNKVCKLETQFSLRKDKNKTLKVNSLQLRSQQSNCTALAYALEKNSISQTISILRTISILTYV